MPVNSPVLGERLPFLRPDSLPPVFLSFSPVLEKLSPRKINVNSSVLRANDAFSLPPEHVGPSVSEAS